MKLRKSATVVAVTCAAMVGAPVAAVAATAQHSTQATSHATTAAPATSFNNIPVTGTAKGGKSFTGHLTVTNFITRGGKTYAVGTLTGTLGKKSISAKQVTLPASVTQGTSGTASSSARYNAQAAAASCSVLNLVLGPLHLNLLGLHVDLNQVVLNITAVPGAGQLLGNLLCDVANLLNGSPLSGANLTGLLNIVEQLANNPGLASL